MITLSTKKVAIYRCVFADYDIVLDERVLIPEADYYLFTDNPALEVYPYKKILIDAKSEPGSLLNRRYKLTLPSQLISYDVTIYLDGNIGIFNNFRELIDEFLLSNSDIGLFRHPNHSSVEDEVALCIANNKASEQVLKDEVKFYSQSKYSKLDGLSDNSILFRRKPIEHVTAAMKEWLDLVKQFSGRDQLSLPFIRSKYSLKEYFFNFSPRTNGNKYFIVLPHNVLLTSSTKLKFLRFKIKFNLKKMLLFYLYSKFKIQGWYYVG